MNKHLHEIVERAHKPENAERYYRLINHTSDVPGGEEFLRDVDKAGKLEESKEVPFSDVEYRRIINRLNKWLNDNGWS